MATFNLFRNDDLLNGKQFHKQSSDLSINKICIKNGLASATLLISCFMGLCALTHKLEINQLGVANLFILAFGVYYALQNFSSTAKEPGVDYFKGFKIGLYTSLIAIVIHTVFIGVYTACDSSILSQMNKELFWTSPLAAAAITLFQGVASAFIITFCIMQYFKKD